MGAQTHLANVDHALWAFVLTLIIVCKADGTTLAICEVPAFVSFHTSALFTSLTSFPARLLTAPIVMTPEPFLRRSF